MKLLRSKKGFTLMEIIVVLIIIAIMAAALIPSFVNFARNARANEYIAQARVGLTAAQAYITNEGARGTDANVAIATLNNALNNKTSAPFEAFQQNLVGDIADRHGFFGLTQGPGDAATTYRVSGIWYIIGTGVRGAGWAVQINDTLGTTEFFRPGANAGSEGTLASAKPVRPGPAPAVP